MQTILRLVPALGLAKLRQALATHPNDRDILEALASFHQAGGESAAAEEVRDRLKALSEKDK